MQEESNARQKQVFLKTEVDSLKNTLEQIQNEKGEGFSREERVQK